MTDTHAVPSRWGNWALWALQILLALTFLAAASGKLLGSADMVSMFDRIGLGQGFRYLTGALEVAGAILLLIPRTAWMGGALLACIMVGAIPTHLFVIGGTFVPALVLLVLSATVARLRRPRG